MISFVVLVSSSQATTVGFVGAANVNQDLPVDYGSSVTGDAIGWTTSDGTGATPDVTLYWGVLPDSSGWDWEFHSAGTFGNLEAPQCWRRLGRRESTNHQCGGAIPDAGHGGRHELNFSVPSGITFILDSFDIGNATDQSAAEGPYGFDLALVR